MKYLKEAFLTPQEWVDALLDSSTIVELHAARLVIERKDFERPIGAWPMHNLLFVERGVFEGEVAGEYVRCEAGQAIWIPPTPKRAYFMRVGGPLSHHYKVRFNLKRDDHFLALRSKPWIKPQAWSVLPCMHQCIDLYQRGGDFYEARLRALLLELSVAFFKLNDHETKLRELNDNQRALLREYVATYIRSGQCRDLPLTPHMLADKLNLSLDYFSRCFRQTFGLAPQSYILRERMAYGESLLSTSHTSIKEISSEVGCKTVGLFCRQFKQHYKLTPSQFRERAPSPDRGGVLTPDN